MLLQGQEMTPLEALSCFDPVTRHEIHGSLEGRFECLWEAVEKHRALLTTNFTATQLMEAQEAIWTALRKLNDRAERAINDQTRVYPID